MIAAPSESSKQPLRRPTSPFCNPFHTLPESIASIAALCAIGWEIVSQALRNTFPTSGTKSKLLSSKIELPLEASAQALRQPHYGSFNLSVMHFTKSGKLPPAHCLCFLVKLELFQQLLDLPQVCSPSTHRLLLIILCWTCNDQE